MSMPPEFRIAQNEAVSFIKSFDAVTADRYARYIKKFDGRDPNKNGWLIIALGHIAYQFGLRLEATTGRPLEEILLEMSRKIAENSKGDLLG